MSVANSEILKVENLVVSFAAEGGALRAVSDVSFSLRAGQTLGIVGESGCGKSVTSLSIMRLLPKPSGQIESGHIWFKGRDIVALAPDQLHSIRGNQISMIFQEPMTALNPVHRVSKQIGEVLGLHQPELSRSDREAASIELLKKVGIPDPSRRLHEFPHQLSGGMRQRVMIAMALACKPDILIADEPTTALDVTIQAQILDLMRELQAEYKMAMIFITHDLGVIAEICDEVVVMYAGMVAEQAPVGELFANPRHPYTRGLLGSIPSLEAKRKSILPIIPGMVPGLAQMPAGCRFQNRCPLVTAACRSAVPPLEVVGVNHSVRCIHWQKGAS